MGYSPSMQPVCFALNDLSESLPPRRMKGTPVEFPPRLGVRSRARLRHHRDEVFAGREASDPRGHAKRRLCAEHRGGRGKPFVNWRGIVVDDIVDASSEFDRQGGRLCRVIDLQERPPRGAAADEWHAAAADLLDQCCIEHAGVGPVECAVAQHNALGRPGRCDDAFQIADRVECAAQLLRRIWIERVIFGFYLPPVRA